MATARCNVGPEVLKRLHDIFEDVQGISFDDILSFQTLQPVQCCVDRHVLFLLAFGRTRTHLHVPSVVALRVALVCSFVIATLGTSAILETVSLVTIVFFALLESKAMPPQWSNSHVMTPAEYSVVKQWLLKQRARRHPTWGRDVPVRRCDFLTEGRKRLPLFGVPVDLEAEEEDMDVEQKQLPFIQQLPLFGGKELPFNLFGRRKLPGDPHQNWSNLDPCRNTMNIPG